MNVQNRESICVAVIGDAHLELGSPKEKIAEIIGYGIIDAGYKLITGGLGGVMEASCRGARKSPKWVNGSIIGLLPGTDPAEANPYVDVVIPTGLDHGRNLIIAQAGAIIAIGGGAGTLSEIALAWIYRRLIIALRCEGWSGRLADQRLDERIRYPDIPEDRVFGASTPEEALRLLDSYVLRYNRRHHRIR
ncbi:MAG: TIGR00725 family protein [Candidatus Methanomethylicaceae archaeon]